jgi:hypothetical protein
MGNIGSGFNPNVTRKEKQNDRGRKEGKGRKIKEKETIDKGKKEMRDRKGEWKG